ncbi:MAG: glycosyltransferase family 2 protein [Phycisphaerae bacterium]
MPEEPYTAGTNDGADGAIGRPVDPRTVESRAERSRALVSVVIPSRNRRELLGRCLEALSRQTHPPYEVVVVDDGSSDGTWEYLARFANDHADMSLRCLRNDSHLGANPSRNRGIRECGADFVAFLDDDCVPAADWLERLVSGFVSERVAAVTGHVDDPDPTNIYELALKGTHRVYGGSSATRLVAGNMCVRRKLLLEHGLDEDRAKASSDIDVSGRADEEGLYLMLKAAGYEQRVVCDAVVLHEHGYSRRTFFRQAYRGGAAAARLGYKYHLPPRVELAPLLLAYLLLPLALLVQVGPLPSALAGGFFLAAILYNEFVRKRKTTREVLMTLPPLVAYYHARLVGYTIQYLRLWLGLDKIQRVRLDTIR